MEKYYLGGYYLTNGPTVWWAKENKTVSTFGCINQQLFDRWCYDWEPQMHPKDEIKKKYQLSDSIITDIRRWTLEKIADGSLEEYGAELFPNLERAEEYKARFFSTKPEVSIYSVYFPKIDVAFVERDFAQESFHFSLRRNLLKWVPEIETPTEELMGFDFIGIDLGEVHSMHCDRAGLEEIQKNFGIELNANGLFDEAKDWQPIREYLNTTRTDWPTYIAKIKKCLK